MLEIKGLGTPKLRNRKTHVSKHLKQEVIDEWNKKHEVGDSSQQ